MQLPTYQAMTPIGQAMQNIAQAMFQARLIRGQREMQEREMAMKQAQHDAEMAMKRPYYAAHADQAAAAAAKDQAETQRLVSAPDTIASSFAGITRPQLSGVRQYQRHGDWTAPAEVDAFDNTDTVAGNFNITQKPDWYTDEIASKLSIADTISAMSGNADQMVKGMQGLSDMQFIESNTDTGAAQTRGRNTAATKGTAQQMNMGEGMVADIFSGALLNTDNPMARSERDKDQAYAAHQLAGARQADTAAGLNRANTRLADARAREVPLQGDREERKTRAYTTSQDKYQKGMVKDQANAVAGLVNNFFGITYDKEGKVTSGTPVRPELNAWVMRDLETAGQPINATTVAQSLQRAAQRAPDLVSVTKRQYLGLSRSDPILRPQLQKPARPVATKTPSLEEYLQAARKANPGVPDDVHRQYWARKYGGA